MSNTILRGARRVRRAMTVVSVVAVGVLLSACAGGATSAGTPGAAGDGSCVREDGGQPTFALVPGTTGDPFYITMRAGAEKRAEERGVKILYQGAAEWNPSLQVPILDSLLIQQPDALLFVPNDVTSLAPAAQKFVDAGIPIVTIDNTLEDDALVKSRITSDNEQGGALAAQRLAELSGNQGKVAVVNVAPGNSTTDARAKGFLDELAKNYPEITVVAHEYNQNSATKASAQTQAILLANPDLAGIFATNLASTEGAGNGVQATGSDVPVVGYDASPSEVKALKDGVVNSLVIQPPAEEGATAVDVACDILAGKTVEKSIVLDNVLATTENANDPAIAESFYREN